MEKWRTNCARAIGLSHVKLNIPCQDNVHTTSANGVNVAVLSDGCGSAHYSHYGSKCFCDAISSYLTDNFDELYKLDDKALKVSIVNHLMNKIDYFIRNHFKMLNDYYNNSNGKVEYNDRIHIAKNLKFNKDLTNRFLFYSLLDATILFVAVKGEKCLIGHCGDGAIFGHDDGRIDVLSSEEKTGDVNETNYPSTIYLLSKLNGYEYIWDLFRITKLDHNPYDGFVLMSDGAQETLIKHNVEELIPLANNVVLLFNITLNETPENARTITEELLTETYRTRIINGSQYEITSDDVSVAILANESLDIEAYKKFQLPKDSFVKLMNDEISEKQRNLEQENSNNEGISLTKDQKESIYKESLKPKISILDGNTVYTYRGKNCTKISRDAPKENAVLDNNLDNKANQILTDEIKTNLELFIENDRLFKRKKGCQKRFELLTTRIIEKGCKDIDAIKNDLHKNYSLSLHEDLILSNLIKYCKIFERMDELKK